eukprot:Pgem_evm1s9669
MENVFLPCNTENIEYSPIERRIIVEKLPLQIQEKLCFCITHKGLVHNEWNRELIKCDHATWKFSSAS